MSASGEAIRRGWETRRAKYGTAGRANAAEKPSHKLTAEQYIARWKANCDINEQGCWVWRGFVYRNGYPGSSYRSKSGRVHRFVYELTKGPIPKGWDCCHTCDIRRCINPLHLFAGTRAVNVQDMRAKKRGNHQKKTACLRGHPFDKENTLIDSRGFRQCRECNRLRQRGDPRWVSTRCSQSSESAKP
jgi:hypothetical protein